MALTKISKEELFDAMIERLPLRPSDGGGEGRACMTGEEIRAAFDRAPKLIAAALDRLIDELEGGEIVNLPLGEDSTTLGARLTYVYSLAEACQATLYTHGKRLGTHDSALSSLKSTDASHEARLASLETEGSALQSKDALHEARLSSLEAEGASLQSTDRLHEARLKTLEEKEIDLSPYAKISDVTDGLALILAALNEALEVTA